MEGENFESVPVDYPPPQVMVEAARDLGPVIEPVAAAAAPDQAIDVGFTEVSGIEQSNEYAGFLDYLKDRVLPELADTAFGKFIDGRDEFANALFNGSAYWPGQHPSESEIIKPEMAEGGIHGPDVEPLQQETNGYQVFGPEIEQPQAFDEYSAMLAASAQRGIEMHHDHDMGMDH